jgi:hypothetical protein
MSTSVPRRTALRAAAVAVAGAAGGAVSACSFSPDSGSGDATDPAGPPATPEQHELVLREGSVPALLDRSLEPSLAVSTGLLERATAVVLVDGGAVRAGTPVATALGIPLLVWGPDTPAELDRLGTRTVVRVTGPQPTPDATATPTDTPVPDDLGGREVVDAPPGGTPEVAGLPLVPPTDRVVALVREDRRPPPATAATLAAVGASTVASSESDVRLAVDAREELRSAPDTTVLGVTRGLGPDRHFAQRVRTVRTAEELPGGGFLPFPERRMVALYGHPQTAQLGMLGEQPPAASVARVEGLAREYAQLSGEPFRPAFELIATVASGSPGADGLYSTRTAIDVLEPYVDAAEQAGVYTVLDLQPGRADFLTQAKAYERLLRRPTVGLALDPEWRLRPNEVHLEQIGSVGIDEVNEVGRWLAALVRDHDLPPKILTLHQFNLGMIRDRQRLDTDIDEIQWLLHADGQGSQPEKQGTWAALRQGLPDGVWLGWKNFEDEDRPMLTPAQTLAQVDPMPYFVSYQ